MTEFLLSQTAWQRYSQLVPGGVASSLRGTVKPQPLFFARGRGSRLWDLDGNEYIDYLCAFGPMILGHSHPAIVQAVLDVVPDMQMNGMCHILEVEAAEALISRIPGAERMLWSNTGTEAVQVALRLARGHTGRNRFVKFAGSYHGWHDTVYLGLDSKFASMSHASSGMPGQYASVLNDVEVLPFNDVQALEVTLARARELDLAAVLLDPINTSGGVMEPSTEFLGTMRQMCDDFGVVLICDEVITGFRVALGGAAERWQVKPDLWTFGKAMAGGFSQSAIVGKREVIDMAEKGYRHLGTYNGNPVAMAAVKASMETLSASGTYEGLERVSRRLESGLNRVFSEHAAPLVANRVGSMIGLQGSAGDGVRPVDSDYLGRLCERLAERGVFMLPIGRLWVSTAHTDEDVDETLVQLSNALDSLKGNGAKGQAP